MLKLVIADDERVIRETISKMMDWEKLGVELIGLCRDGIELYHMILDESPDIVMTDIRMPGLSGLEVVREIAETNKQIQFIFLSGYEEFDYAREAMKYGVKHYLLKPCSEKKMEEAILQAKEDCRKMRGQMEAGLRQNNMLRIIHQDAMFHMLMEGLIWKESETLKNKVEELVDFYGQYLEWNGSCYLYYVYYLEQECLEQTLWRLKEKEKQRGSRIFFYGVYVKNTLILLSYEPEKKEILAECMDNDLTEISEERYESLEALLEKLLRKIRRFDTVYAIHDYRVNMMFHNQGILQYIQDLCGKIGKGNEEGIDELLSMAREATKPEILQMLGNVFCTRMLAVGVLTIVEVTEVLCDVNLQNEMEHLRELTVQILLKSKEKLRNEEQHYGMITERVMACVEEHLSECDLTLKKISEEYLYMNVDYVSRTFRKSTGKKFSQYLTEQRVRRAKEFLMNGDNSKIQYVAEQVGCGNNPQYFSQIFKKLEGVTPGKWAAGMKK